MAASDEVRPRSAQDRRSFLRTSGGYATGLAAAVALPAAVRTPAAGAAEVPGTAIEHPATAPPSEPVMAYVHDAERGEVTIMSGTLQTTYRDPGLVRRLLDAAGRKGS